MITTAQGAKTVVSVPADVTGACNTRGSINIIHKLFLNSDFKNQYKHFPEFSEVCECK
jgi:hypothetical protein